jgi:type I restriction enzyme S subunit
MTKIITLEEVCEVIAGQSPPSSTYNSTGEGLPFFQGKADFGQYSPTVRIWCNAPQKIAEKGDILISVRAPVGPTNLCDQKACIGRGLSAIRAGNKIETSYLQYFLKKNEQKLSDSGRGSTFSSITQKDLKQIQIPLPSLEEQKRIVRELDAADVLRQKRKQAIALLDDYLKAVFFKMFGDPVTNSKGWQIRSLGEMIDFMTSGSRGWARYYADSGEVFLRIQNVERNNLKIDDLCFVNPPDTAESKRTKVRQGDVLLSITADLGRTAVIPENFGNAYISQHLALLRFKTHYLPEYISEFLASQGGAVQMSKLNKGGTKAGLNFNDIKSIQIPVPDVKIQQAYIARKKHIQGIKQFMLSQDDELETNFIALMQKVFS